jgi:hypothetical protein
MAQVFEYLPSKLEASLILNTTKTIFLINKMFSLFL